MTTKLPSAAWRYLPALLTLLTMALLASTTARAADADRFFDQSLGDFRGELKSAQQAGKRGLLLMFEQEGCPYCRKMREQVLSQPEVQAYFRQNFLIFSVDMLGDVEIQDTNGRSKPEKTYARELHINGTPTFVFIGADGSVLTRYVGATRDVAEFMQLGRYVVDGFYKTQSFAEYRKSRTGKAASARRAAGIS